ncbi:MAG: restriction endonuclease subunit S [Phenylobacterium sp.]|uniref:restriction endonuclease subunit S n=1 Tax=Phenylobacterium sp. TaxID=1871053 RepID=UPI0025FE72F9|nr:restriction endonuclease subunit S [Phenylobacterium sp.]MCA3757318.1 restriction endonuclease subunit S [Phenylobacterium sp.]
MRELEFQASDWQEVALGDVCVFRGGNGFKEEFQGQASGDHPFIKVSDLNLPGNEKYVISSRNWVSDAVRKSIGAALHPAGAVVFAKVGAALRLNRRRILSVPTAIDNNMMTAVPDYERIDAEYLYYFLLVQDLGRFCQESAVPSVNQRHLSSIEIGLPTLPEQRKITTILRTWDEAIETLQDLRAAKAGQLEALTDHLIHRTQSLKAPLQGHLKEISTRNRDRDIERVLSVTNSAGFVLADEQFSHRVASVDTSNYKIVRLGQFAYNPSRINVGSIARLEDWAEGALSPMYVVFEVKRTLDAEYFFHWLVSRNTRRRIALAAQGSVRETVSFESLGSIAIPLPNLDDQRKIARALTAVKSELLLLEREIAVLARQKRGLIQKLLTGEWRVIVDTAPLVNSATENTHG